MKKIEIIGALLVVPLVYRRLNGSRRVEPKASNIVDPKASNHETQRHRPHAK